MNIEDNNKDISEPSLYRRIDITKPPFNTDKKNLQLLLVQKKEKKATYLYANSLN